MERNAWPYVSHQQKSGGQASSSFPEELQLVTRVRVGLDKEGVLPAVIPEPGGSWPRGTLVRHGVLGAIKEGGALASGKLERTNGLRRSRGRRGT